VLLLAPALPLLFMGQEWGSRRPFLFFTDLGPEVGPLVSQGRRREFERFPEFAEPGARERIPDPQSPETRARSVLDWSRIAEPDHQQWLEFHRALLDLRQKEVAPLLAREPVPTARWSVLAPSALEVVWTFPAGPILRVVANLGPTPVAHAGPARDWGRRLHAVGLPAPGWTELPPWSAGWYLSSEDAQEGE
jgi:1,4-alpha-glucan branching enzyme